MIQETKQNEPKKQARKQPKKQLNKQKGNIDQQKRTIIPIILAGGSGTRLWPVSIGDSPKQFLSIDGSSLLSHAVRRARTVITELMGTTASDSPPCLIVTAERWLDACKNHLIEQGVIVSNKTSASILQLTPQSAKNTSTKRESERESEQNNDIRAYPVHMIGEPVAKNTAPAIGLAMDYLTNLSHQKAWSRQLGDLANAMLLVITSDHLISPLHDFVKAVKLAYDSLKDYSIITFGVTPTRPETGFGYIEYKETAHILHAEHFTEKTPNTAAMPRTAMPRTAQSKQAHQLRCKEVVRFIEKPPLAQAQNFIKQNRSTPRQDTQRNTRRYVWNSGMFCFTMTYMQEAFVAHAPALAHGLTAISQHTARWILDKQSVCRLARLDKISRVIFADVPEDSIDYAVMEHVERSGVVPVDFEWNDLGSWREVAPLLAQNPPWHALEASENVTLVARDHSLKALAVCGVSDISVIIEEGRLLIVKKGFEQIVKKIGKKRIRLDKK